MITLLPVDGGTKPVIRREWVPGMDWLTWNECDCEEPTPSERKESVINQNMYDSAPITVTPWPRPLTYHMPVDFDSRHEGLQVRLDSRSQYFNDVGPAPGGELYQVSSTNWDPIRSEHNAITRQLSPAEIRDWVENPNDWIRLDFGNEEDGKTGLGQQLRWTFHHTKKGGPYRFALEDNLHFTPFDTSLMVNGEPAYRARTETQYLEWPWADLYEGGEYVIHLRPRRWWYSVRVVATYIFASFFELFFTDRIFITQHWDRPPVYPIRHDVVRTAQHADVPDMLGDMCAFDLGVAERYLSSSSAQTMRTAIQQGEIHHISYVFLIYDVSPATLFISTEVPQPGEIVCGITPREVGLEAGETIWIEQVANLSSVYPRQQIGTFFAEFYL